MESLIWKTKFVSLLFVLLLCIVSCQSATIRSRDTCLSYENVQRFLEENVSDYFPNFDGDATARFPMSTCNGMVIEEASIDELQQALEDGSFTSVQLLWCYLERIHQVEEYVTSV